MFKIMNIMCVIALSLFANEYIDNSANKILEISGLDSKSKESKIGKSTTKDIILNKEDWANDFRKKFELEYENQSNKKHVDNHQKDNIKANKQSIDWYVYYSNQKKFMNDFYQNISDKYFSHSTPPQMVADVWYDTLKKLGWKSKINGKYQYDKVVVYNFFSEYYGKSIYIKNDLSKTNYPLQNKYKFSYYDIKFVQFLRTEVLPKNKNSILRKSSQWFYDKYLKQHIDLYYRTYHVLRDNQKLTNFELKNYKKALKNKSVYTDWYYNYVNILEDDFKSKKYLGIEENIFDNSNTNYSKTGKLRRLGFDSRYSWKKGEVFMKKRKFLTSVATAFWLRRFIDGSDKEFYLTILKLKKLYE